MPSFFFSSRRRHTRSDRDWSSDVCSSDLMIRHTRSDRDWSSDVCSSDLFYGFNRPGAKASEAIIQNWWRQGMMGGAKAHYDGIVAFSQKIGRASCRERV